MLRSSLLCGCVTVVALVSCSEQHQNANSATAEAYISDTQTVVVDSAKFASAVDLISTTLNQLDDLRTKHLLFVKPVNVEHLYGEASFYKGKIVSVSWRKDPMEPLISVCFDENEQIVFYMTHSQGTDYFSEMFFLDMDQNPLYLQRSGYFSEQAHAFRAINASQWAQQFMSESYSIEHMANLFHATGARAAQSDQGTLYYSGQIGDDLSISLILNRHNDWASGRNYYLKSASDYEITADFKANRVVISEKDGDVSIGKFEGSVADNGNMNGQWQSADGLKKLKFELERVNKLKLPNGEMLIGTQKSNPALDNLVLELNTAKMPEVVAAEMNNTFSLSSNHFLWSGLSTMQKLDSFIVDAAFYQDRIKSLAFDRNGREIYQRYFLSVYNALPEAFENRHSGYYRSEQANYEKQERLFAALIYCMDRSPNNLKNWWDHFKNNWSELIYKGYFSSFDKEAVELIAAYEYLRVQDEAELKMKMAYDAISSLDQSTSTLETQRPYLSALMQSNKEDQLWAYSFWMRRFNEENHEMVYQILKEAYASVITAEFEYD